MPHDLHLDLLRRMPLFHGIRDDILALLLEATPVVQKAAGERFFQQGEDALYMYVLESGQVSVSKEWQGKDHELATLGPGECFGEVALIDLYPRSASVSALTPCRAIEISSVHLYRVHEADVEQFIVIQANIARELCRRLRLADDRQLPALAGQTGTTTELAWPALLTV